MALTEVQIRQAKPEDKRYMLRDDRGLYLEVMTSGNKHWRLRYWEAGKERKISLGEYPAVSLRQARDKRDEIRLNRAQGISPKRTQEGAPTFEKIAQEWFERFVVTARTPGHSRTVNYRLERYLFPALGTKHPRDITAPELLDLLRGIERQGTIETMHRVKQICGQIFRFAIASGEMDYDLTAGLKGALPPALPKHHASITNPKKIAILMDAIAGYAGSLVVFSALKFSAYTFARPGEIRHAEWCEIDIEKAEWRIPAEKMKMRRTHIVPLSHQALTLIEGIKPFTGRGRYVFPSARSTKGDRPMSENAVRLALRTMGFGPDEMTAHGFRSMASTILHEQGWPSDAIERQLAHVEGNSVKAAYNYAEYLTERRKMMQAWADWLDGLKNTPS